MSREKVMDVAKNRRTIEGLSEFGDWIRFPIPKISNFFVILKNSQNCFLLEQTDQFSVHFRIRIFCRFCGMLKFTVSLWWLLLSPLTLASLSDWKVSRATMAKSIVAREKEIEWTVAWGERIKVPFVFMNIVRMCVYYNSTMANMLPLFSSESSSSHRWWTGELWWMWVAGFRVRFGVFANG